MGGANVFNPKGAKLSTIIGSGGVIIREERKGVKTWL